MKRILMCALLLSMSVVLSATVCLAKEASSSTPKVTAKITAKVKETKAAAKEDGNKVVAKVNGSVITEAELDRELAMIKQRYEGSGRTLPEDRLKALKGKILDGLVNRDLLYGVCLKDGIKADGKDVEKAFQMLKARYKDDDAFKKMLQKYNLTEDYIKQDIGRELAIKKMIDTRFSKKIEVTDKEAKAYYDKNKANFKQPAMVKASHILIKVNEDAVPEIKAKAKARILEIKKKIENGADFAEMAKKYSEGPSAAKGGDLGYFRRGQMVKPFEDAAFALKPGQVSDVVETRFGYHLIKSFDKKEATVIPFEQLKPRIIMFLKQGKLRQEISAFIDSLRAKSTIQISKADQAK